MGEKTNRALVAYGDATRMSTFSGTPYFVLEAGRRNGLLREGVRLYPERFRRHRLLWNALRPVLLDHPRGFQYSRAYLRRLWADGDVPEGVDEFLSHFPLLPPAGLGGADTSFYIDTTAGQYVREYGHQIGRRVRADALSREREAYHAARLVLCMARWCADDVISSYDVPAEKVRVVTPGANLEDARIPPSGGWDGNLSPLRIGMIGRAWRRKGGPLVVEAASHLRRMGISTEVVVIGPDPSRMENADTTVRALGFMDKRVELARFVETVRSFHFGCLFSRAEAFGISLVECLRLGVPVIARDVGGVPDAVPDDAGVLLPADATAETLAEELAAIVRAPERYAALRAAAERDAERHSWDRAASEILTMLDS